MTRRFSVGSIVFIISSEHNKVLPLQIVEEITRKTLKGDEVHYKVVYGVDQSKAKLLSEIKGEIFTTLDEVRSHLMKNVTSWVSGQIDAAAKAANTWYKQPNSSEFPEINSVNDLGHQMLETSIQEDPHSPSESETNLVELPDGRVVKARVKQVSK